MIYADYKFYKESYGGAVIPAADFTQAARYASRKIDEITFQRAADRFNDFADDIMLATCAVAEALYEHQGKDGIASERVGDYSVSYRMEGGLVSRAIRQAARPYLIGTGLMSRRIS